MLDVIRATDERMIAPQYLMQMFAHLAFSYTTLIHHTCTVGLVKHLSPYTKCIINLLCMRYFCTHTKKTITAHCSLRDNFSANVTEFIVYK